MILPAAVMSQVSSAGLNTFCRVKYVQPSGGCEKGLVFPRRKTILLSWRELTNDNEQRLLVESRK